MAVVSGIVALNHFCLVKLFDLLFGLVWVKFFINLQYSKTHMHANKKKLQKQLLCVSAFSASATTTRLR